MAKRTNIIRTLLNEIEKGNLYLDSQGNSINFAKLESIAKEDYIKGLKDGTLDMNVSWNDFLQGYTDKLLFAETVIAELKNMGLQYSPKEEKEEKEVSKDVVKTSRRVKNIESKPKNGNKTD